MEILFTKEEEGMKYSFTGETRVIFGITLRKIKYETGEEGGWIEKEANLFVYGDARVSGDAQVYGNAQVSGNAQVYGNARVSGDARVYGDAWAKTPLCIHGTKWSVSVSSKTTISIGCNTLTPDDWDKRAEALGAAEGLTATQIKEYLMYIEMCKQWMAIYCKEAI